MNNALRANIKAYWKDYLALKRPEIKMTGNKLFRCPFESEHSIKSDKPSANEFPPASGCIHCFEPTHGKLGDIFSLVRRFEEDKSQWTDEAIGEYLIDFFKIQTDDKVEKALIFYQQNNFDLVPVEKNGKAAIEKEWTKKIHKNIVEWQDWLSSSLNIGIKTGKASNITVIDFDLHGEEFPKDIQELIGETLVQKTKNGFHYVFGYEEDIPKTNFDLDKIHIDVMADGGQIVCFPSIIDGIGREWNDSPIAKMPKEFKDWLLQYIKPSKQENKEQTPNFEDIKIQGLQGCCNSTFVKLGGICRKFLTQDQTSKVLFLFNSLLEEPMEDKVIRAMLKSLEQYDLTDKNDLKNKVLAHLELVGEASSRDLKDSLGYAKAEIEQILAQLLKEELIYKTGRLYRFMNRITWNETFIGESKHIDYKMPYFDSIATFRDSDMIILGAPTGHGKSHLALNIIKQLVNQGKKPYYLSTEPGNRFASISLALGLKEGDFYWFNHYSPENVELPENGICIVDFFAPDQYCDTQILYKKFAQQMDKKKGNIIIMVQLKEDGEWFAPNQILFYASLAAKLRYPNKADREHPILETYKIRESKSKMQFVTIPLQYNFESKILSIKDEKK